MQRIWWYDSLDCDESDNECLFRWRVLHIAAIVSGSLSICACILMISTAIKYRKLLSKLSFAAQIPIYIAITDLGIFSFILQFLLQFRPFHNVPTLCEKGYEIFHASDHWWSLINLYVAEGDLCLFFGSMKQFWISYVSPISLFYNFGEPP